MIIDGVAHLSPGRIRVYLGRNTREGSAAWPLPAEGTITDAMRYANAVLADEGWAIGVDGWRAPLSADSELIATAHLTRVGPRRGRKRLRYPD